MSAGILSLISFAKESTWGAAVTPTKSVAVRPTGGLEVNPGITMIPAIKGQLQKNYAAIQGKNTYSGSYTMDAFADYIGYFILSAFGTDTPSLYSGETTVYNHVFTESTSKPSLTVQQAIGENVRNFAGVMVKSFKITGKVGEMLEFEVALMGKTQASASEITGAFSTVAAFNHAQMAFKLGGSTVGEVISFELEFDSGLDFVYAMGSHDPQFQTIKGGSEVKGKMDLYLDSTTLPVYTNFLSDWHESAEFIATGTAIGNAATYGLDCLVPEAVYHTIESKVTDAENLLSVSFEGLYNVTAGKMLGITLTNLLSSY